MERFDVSEGDRFAEMVSAARAGEAVEIVENGEVVVQMTTPARPLVRADQRRFRDWLEDHWRTLPPEITGGDAAAEVRAMRDEGDH